jgi:hypothetical protein
MKIFTVHDSTTDTYINPFCMASERDAIQGLKQMVNATEENNYSLYPEDFNLMCLGDFDNRSGHISLNESFKVVVNAAKLKEN